MKTIKATTGENILVSDCDFEKLSKHNWYVQNYKGTSYAKTGNKGVPMHRMILGLTNPEILVDHADKNGLNNQRENIRMATRSQNAMNKEANGEIQYKGVSIVRNKPQKYFHKGTGEYRYSTKKELIVARIKVNGKSIHIGTFDTIEDAALAYNEAARKYHGEFAVLNKIKD